MSDMDSIFSFVSPREAREILRGWVRAERHRAEWTQSELARRSGIPPATISRLELTGLCSTDVLFKLLFALNRLDAFIDYLKERQRLAEVPLTLREPERKKVVKRIRHTKEEP